MKDRDNEFKELNKGIKSMEVELKQEKDDMEKLNYKYNMAHEELMRYEREIFQQKLVILLKTKGNSRKIQRTKIQ